METERTHSSWFRSAVVAASLAAGASQLAACSSDASGSGGAGASSGGGNGQGASTGASHGSGGDGGSQGTSSGGSAQATFPLSISPDKRSLQDGNGKPFLMQGDSAWSAI